MNKIKPKEPILAIFLNSWFLGLGHFYAGAKIKGTLILIYIAALLSALYFVAFYPNIDLKFLSFLNNEFNLLFLLIIQLALFAIYVLILIDGYRTAQKFNIHHELERKISTGMKTLLIIGTILANLGLNAALPIALIIRTQFIQAFKIPSRAMEPTLIPGDRLIAYKPIYRSSKPQRGDIAVFIYPRDEKKSYIKRVIGLENETVEIISGDIYINGQLIEDPRIKNIYYYNKGEYGKEGQKVHVPEGCYYVLGDNSMASADSRYWGFVPEKNFIGKAVKIYYPFDRSRELQ